ncbi:hypothetical protein BX667DRAFT_507965 [Coemansia mojavensis]|nr:hypothetical protein BX667DRAFT_507965 [Coemansia mojavensis]
MYRSIINLLNFQLASWSNVGSIRLEFGQNALETLNDTYVDPQAFLSLLYRNFPKLTELDISVFGSEHGVDCNFLNQLTDVFIPRLTKLSTDTDLTLQRLPQCLTKLELTMLPLSIQNLPMINPCSLQQLSIFDVVPGFKWSIFTASDKGIVEFSNLQKLNIGYSTDANPHIDAQVRLSFPILKQLGIFRCPTNCNLLSKSFYTKKLEKMVIHCANGTAPLATTNIVSCKKLILLVSTVDDGHNKLYHQATNSIFKSSWLSDNPALVILNKQAMPNLELINWVNLSSLSICTSITTTNLLRLLDKLPKLQELTVKFLISNHWQHRANIHDRRVSDSNCSNVSFLSINFALDPKVTGMDIDFIFYMLVRFRLLKCVKSSPSLMPKIKKLATMHSSSYPHFEDLVLAPL